MGRARGSSDNRVTERVEAGSRDAHPLVIEPGKQLKRMIGRLAQSILIQQTVATEKSFPAVAHLIVDVAQTPIRESVGLLGNLREQPDDEGGFRRMFATMIDGV